MNLFDGLTGADWNDPKTMATMQLAAGLLGGAGPSRTPQSFGGLLGAGLTGYQNTMSAAAKQRLLEEEFGIKRSEFDMMKSDRERKMEAEKRALEQRQQMEATIQKMDPTGRLWLAYQADPKVVAEQLFPKIESPYSKIDPKDYTAESFAAFEESRSPMNPNGDRRLLRAARPVEFVNGVAVDKFNTKPGTTINDPNRPFGIGPDGQPLANQPYQTYAERVARAGATNVKVNEGQRGFTNERDMRKDYETLPETKAFGELTGTISLIRTAAQSPTPANDLALATKFMKLLDPGSVVRESELSMAMGATGLLDKVSNYAAQVTQGVKLTPSQRQDFLTAANRIFAAAEAHQAKVAQRARDNAARWMINPDAVAPVITPTTIDNGGWSIRPK